MASRGLLLLNIGTPNSAGTDSEGRVLPPSVEQVREYLREFLMDPRVVDIPAVARWLLVNGIILRTRPAASRELYARIWTDRGSPLLVHTQDFRSKLQQRLGAEWVISVGMRYGTPSIRDALSELSVCNVESILVLPLFPQFSEATTGSILARVKQQMDGSGHKIPFRVFNPFYRDEGFLDAFAERIREHSEFDAVVFSFHGLPERHIRKAAKHATACLNGNCCETIAERNRDCYRAQCFETARLLAARAGLDGKAWKVGFQSRLGVSRWIGPATELVLSELAGQGAKRVLVICPSFVADCLETLEEIGIRARDQFISAGGEELTLVPSLNASDAWVGTVASWVLTNSRSSCI